MSERVSFKCQARVCSKAGVVQAPRCSLFVCSCKLFFSSFFFGEREGEHPSSGVGNRLGERVLQPDFSEGRCARVARKCFWVLFLFFLLCFSFCFILQIGEQLIFEVGLQLPRP